MTAIEERLTILDLVDTGRISADEAIRRLGQLAEAPVEAAGADEAAGEASSTLARWQGWWMLPAAAGTAVLLVGVILSALAYSAWGLSLGLACAALPAVAGGAVALLGVLSRRMHWLHVRIDTGEAEWPRRIAISLPLPTRLAAWALRLAGPFVPQLKDRGFDDLILALADQTSTEAPFFIDVTDDAEGGERVQLYFG